MNAKYNGELACAIEMDAAAKEQYATTVGRMVAYLDREAIAARQERHYRKMIREVRNPVPDLKAHLRATAAEGDVQKVMLFTRNAPEGGPAADRIREEVTASFPVIKTTASTWNNLEFNIASANKGNSLRRFAEHLGFTLENCIAFGDGLNDLSMIEAAGTGVAMANAHPQVLAAADLVTASNDEDGVARTLREIGAA